jgi:hypothetical protein
MSISRVLRSPREAWRAGLPAALLAAVVLAIYAPTVRNGFVSDDYLFLGMAAKGPESVLTYHGGYHYYPFGMALFFLQYTLWGLDPAGYHWVGIGLHLAAALLVVRLGRSLGLPVLACWAAALLFATNGLIHEVPLWAIGILYSLSTCLYLAALLAYLDHVRTARRRSLALFLALLAAALLTHEQSLTLLPVCGLATLLVVERPETVSRGSWWWRRTQELLPAVGLVAVFLGLKLVFNDGTHLAPGITEGLASRVGPFALHLLRVLVPNLSKAWAWQILDPSLPGWAANLCRLALVVSAGLFFLRLTPRLRFLALWTGLHVGVMVLAIGMASRHYYLPLVPASLLVASLLVSLAEKVGEKVDRLVAGRSGRPALASWLLPLLLAPLVLAGLTVLTFRKAVWAEASALGQDLLDQTVAMSRQAPAARSLYLVDLPDGLPLGESDPAYIFRLGFEDALKLQRIGPRFVGITRLHGGSTEPWKEPFGRLATDAEILALAADPANLVLRYDPALQRFQRVR